MDLRNRVLRLDQIGSAARPAASVTPDEQLAEVLAVLDAPDFPSLTCNERATVLYRIHLLYSGFWHASGCNVIPSAERAAQALFNDDTAPLNALCVAYDLLFFLYWCWYTSIDQQVPFGHNVVEPFSAAIRRRRKHVLPPVQSPKPRSRRVGYVAEFISPGPGNAMAGASKGVLTALATASPDAPPILYAWLFHDPKTLADYAALGIKIRAITGNSIAERIEIAQRMIEEDAPDVLISDMNASLPTVLFENRLAPIQIFYQFGMPIWPVSQVDAVFHVWDFDLGKAGLAGRPHKQLMIPYDLARYAGPADPELLRIEREALPAGRLVGTYGRLSKITPAFIEAVAAGIATHPDVTVVIGGSGDGSAIRDKIEAMDLADRFVVFDRFVDGHIWGHLLDVFLDTFPLPGGASCLEMIAKGKPVVSLLSPEAANLSREQRVQSLVGTKPDGYGRILDRLLGDAEFYEEACRDTRRLAARYPTDASYRVSLTAAIDSLRRARDVSERWAPIRRGLRRLLWRG